MIMLQFAKNQNNLIVCAMALALAMAYAFICTANTHFFSLALPLCIYCAVCMFVCACVCVWSAISFIRLDRSLARTPSRAFHLLVRSIRSLLVCMFALNIPELQIYYAMYINFRCVVFGIYFEICQCCHTNFHFNGSKFPSMWHTHTVVRSECEREEERLKRGANEISTTILYYDHSICHCCCCCCCFYRFF